MRGSLAPQTIQARKNDASDAGMSQLPPEKVITPAATRVAPMAKTNARTSRTREAGEVPGAHLKNG
jgi:hypothetical protein